MHEQPMSARGPALGRWIVVAALIALCLGLYFWFAPRSQPPARPPALEGR
jgi:hypothetical protein